jgi:oxygen-dependent protoporphyrinogen oxidase
MNTTGAMLLNSHLPEIPVLIIVISPESWSVKKLRSWQKNAYDTCQLKGTIESPLTKKGLNSESILALAEAHVKTAIIGAGISGLATGQAILASNREAEVVVYESAPRTGGKVHSEITDEGYLCEWGVNAFLDKSPRTLELCEEIGLTPVSGDVAAKKRYVFSEGELHKLPEKPPEFFASRLLSFPARLRVIGEIFSGKAKVPDETLEAFGTRHLGREAYQKLIDPMASGVFAGDASKMSLKSCFNLTSFATGMSVMTDTLTAGLGSRVQVNSPVSSISRSGAQYTVHFANGDNEDFDHVILATPAWAQSAILNELSPRLSHLLQEIQYPPLTVVCLGYREQDVAGCMDGFGFLVPSREQRDILGTVADSNVFPGRAPAGSVLYRTMVGGARYPHLADLEDGPLLDRVQSDLRDIMNLRAEPGFVKIYRHTRAIPQYLVGHAARLEAIEEQLSDFPGLVLTGNAFRGVSLNDCVLNAGKTAQKLKAAYR